MKVKEDIARARTVHESKIDRLDEIERKIEEEIKEIGERKLKAETA